MNRILNAIQPPGIQVKSIEFNDDGGFTIHLQPTKHNDDDGDVDPQGIGGGTIKSLDGD